MMAEVMTLSGDYGFQSTRLTPEESVTIDASDANWIVANIGAQTNRYPVIVEGGTDVSIVGGTVEGRVPMDIDWTNAYVNSAALFLQNPDDVLVQDWSISRAWDGIRIRGDEDASFALDGVRLSHIRDDAIENDNGVSGTISNSFFDGVFVGLSTGEANMPDRTDNVVKFDNVIVRMEESLYKGRVTHQSPFKTFENSPQMEIHNSIFAIEDPNHAGQARLGTAWNKTISSSNNYYLNLSDTPFPRSYPLPGEGFTILQGQEARDFYAKAAAEWENEDSDDDADGGTPGGARDSVSQQQVIKPTGNQPEQNDQESRNESAREDEDSGEDDDSPGGFFGIIARILQAIFGGGGDSDDDVREADAGELVTTRNSVAEDDLSSIMLPPGDDTSSAGYYDDSEDDGLVFA
jgi:hypothetical protein